MEPSKSSASKLSAAGILLALLLGAMAVMTAPAVQADTANDLARLLGTQRYYVTDAVKANTEIMAKNPNLESDIRNTVNRLKGDKDARIAVLSNAIIPSQYGTDTQRYGDFLYGFLNPKPEVLILVNAQTSIVSLISDKLSSAERQTIINDSRSTFNQSGLGAGATFVADKAIEKIQSNQSTGTFTTIGIVVVVLLLIAGAVAYMLITTRKNWTRKVAPVEELANKVSDQVVRVSDEVNFLPDANRASTDADFGAATRNFSDANSQLRELQKVSPVTLLLKGPEFERKLNLTGAQFEQARQALSRVEQQVKSLPGL
jgi:hypothetical protein